MKKKKELPALSFRGDGFFRALTIAAIALLALFAILAALHIAVASASDKAIRAELEPLLARCAEETGANSFTVRVCAEPDEFRVNPFDQDYHVFVTAHYDTLRRKTEAQWRDILKAGNIEMKSVWSYYGTANEMYGITCRAVANKTTGRLCDTFLSVSDGTTTYSLASKNLRYAAPDLKNFDAYDMLHPAKNSKAARTNLTLAVVMLLALAALLGRKLKNRSALKQAAEEYRALCAERGVGAEGGKDVPPELSDILKKYKLVAGKGAAAALYALGERSRSARLAAGRTGTEGDGGALGGILDEVDAEVGAEMQAKRARARRKKLAVALGAVVVLAIAAVLVVKLWVVPAGQYRAAMALRDEGRDDEALERFRALGNYKDSREICDEYSYNDAVALLSVGDYGRAYQLFGESNGHADAAEKMAAIEEAFPWVSVLRAAPGDVIELGSYEQDNDTDNGAEPVEWIVLSNQGGVLFAVSKYVLDTQQYNTANGEGSTLKQWLKEDFYETTFADVDGLFVSKVGLLTRKDMDLYRSYAGVTPEWTAYAMAQKPEKHYYAGYSWWLDAEYFTGFAVTEIEMAVVIESGSYSNNVCDVKARNGVRPAITIDTSGSEIDYYLEDYDDIANSGITTRTAAAVKAETDRILGRTSSGNSGNSSGDGKRVCSSCNGTGRVTVHFGNTWNKREGYGYGDKCARCGGTGYVS